MIKALIRTVLLVVAILLAVRLFPALAPYQNIALIVAVVSGLVGFIARSLLVLCIVAAAAAAYFLHIF
jgi:hypothetical protein